MHIVVKDVDGLKNKIHMNFIIFLLSTIGLTLIITKSYIFKPVRNKLQSLNKNLGKLINCSQCVGFYAGILIQFIILYHERLEFIFYWGDLFYIIYGFIGSFVSYLIYLLLMPLITKYD